MMEDVICSNQMGSTKMEHVIVNIFMSIVIRIIPTNM